MRRKRLLTIFLVLALVILTAIGSWIAGSTIQSPAEVAARTAPPTPSPILVPIEARVLTSAIVTRGTARYGLPLTIALAPSALKAGPGVITTLPLRNTQIKEGDVLLTASGRPVFVLQGAVPTYRDLVPGSVGADVRQVEDGLQRLGFDPSPVDGSYDEQTSAAVAAWYRAAGWQPFGPTADQQGLIRTLEQQLAKAINEQAAAAERAAAAPLALAAAQATADQATKAAAAELATMRTQRDEALTDPTQSANRASAERAFEVAEAGVKARQLEGEVAIQTAINAQKVAEREANLAAAVVAQNMDELAIARRNSGVQIPVDEIVFIPTLPVRVEAINVAVGDVAKGSLLLVTNNQLALDSSLPLDEASLIKPGLKVFIDEPTLGVEATGIVSRVAATPGTEGVDGFHLYFETVVDTTTVSLEGFSLRLTIPVESTGGEVLAVPVSALSMTADGSSRVQVENQGAFQFVVVEPGLVADGFVEVTPVEGTLTPSQLVLIGYENP